MSTVVNNYYYGKDAIPPPPVGQPPPAVAQPPPAVAQPSPAVAQPQHPVAQAPPPAPTFSTRYDKPKCKICNKKHYGRCIKRCQICNNIHNGECWYSPPVPQKKSQDLREKIKKKREEKLVKARRMGDLRTKLIAKAEEKQIKAPFIKKTEKKLIEGPVMGEMKSPEKIEEENITKREQNMDVVDIEIPQLRIGNMIVF